jgi:hypothetical protein
VIHGLDLDGGRGLGCRGGCRCHQRQSEKRHKNGS